MPKGLLKVIVNNSVFTRASTQTICWDHDIAAYSAVLWNNIFVLYVVSAPNNSCCSIFMANTVYVASESDPIVSPCFVTGKYTIY